jgi:hypothetical protein
LDGEDFNAEAFLDVKQENLHAYPNLLMDQAIEAMTKHLKQPLPPLVNVPPKNKTHTSLNYQQSIKQSEKAKM